MGDDRGCSLGVVGLAFVSGGLVGAAVALLLAPQTGRKSRAQLQRYARRAEKNINELAETATEVLDHAVDKGREFIKDKQAVLTEAVEAGRTALQWEAERPSSHKKT
ncbi:MAG: YtxH domain-containing protein [Nitrospirota bacterium]